MNTSSHRILRIWVALPALALALFVLLVTCQPASAAPPECTVTTTGDGGAGSLREALGDAVNCEVIVFDGTTFATPQTIQLASSLVITRAVTVDGAANGVYTPTIAGPGPGVTYFRVISNTATGAATLNQLIIANGNLTGTIAIDASGAGIYNAGALTLTNSILTQNRTASPTVGNGGGIYNAAGGSLSLANSAVISNTARRGGALYVANGNVTIDNSVVASNVVTYANAEGAGVYMIAGIITVTNNSLIANNRISGGIAGAGGGMNVQGGSIVVLNSTIAGNQAYAQGGGLFLYSGVSADVTGSTIFNNTTTRNQSNDSGGGVSSSGVLTLTNCTVANNRSTGSGGGVYASLGRLVISGTTFTDNAAANGAAIDLESGVAAITGNTVARNTMGPAIYAIAALTLDNVNIYSNTAGAIFATAPLTVLGGNIYSNTRSAQGAAISAAAALTLTNVNVMTNSTTGGNNGGAVAASTTLLISGGLFQNNTCAGNCRGGAIYVGPTATNVVLNDVSFIRNASNGRGGAISADGAATSFTMTGTQFISNTTGANSSGGGLFVTGNATITNAQFISNTAQGSGGGINLGGDARVSNSVFQKNAARYYGGGGGLNSNGAVTLTNVVMMSNTAEDRGGGLYALSFISVTASQFITNSATNGGAIEARSGGAVVDSTFERNTAYAAATGNGGAIESGDSFAMAITNTQFLTNTSLGTATSGGGAVRAGGPTRISGGVFQGNKAKTYGAGIYIAGATFTSQVSNATFTGNQANGSAIGYGGGIYAEGPLTVTGGSFTENYARSAGGAINALGATTLSAVRLTQNSAGTQGGGVNLRYAATSARILNSLLDGNSAPTGAALFDTSGGATAIQFSTFVSPTLGAGEAIVIDYATARLVNSIVASYTTAITVPNTYASLDSDYNLFYNTDVPVVTGTHSITGQDPLFRDPAGGSYQLRGDSPAVGRALDIGVTTDLIGAARPQGIGFDLGSYQVNHTWYVDPAGSDANGCASAGPANACRTIAAAIGKAITGDSIYIAAGVYTENLTAGVPLHFYGAGAASTIVDGNAAGRVFTITAGDVTFADLTVQHGLIRAGTEACGATDGCGGGIYANDALTLTNVNVLSNTVSEDGGGVYARTGVTVTGGLFRHNIAENTGNLVEGGGAALYSPFQAVVSGTQFISNSVTGQGNGGALLAIGDLTLTNVQFLSNTVLLNSSNGGGGAYAGGAATVAGALFQANTCVGTGGQGGAIYAATALTMTNFTLIGNRAESGGGAAYTSGPLVLANGVVQENASLNGSGGGLYTPDTLALTNVDVLSNTAPNDGGGAWVFYAVTMNGGRFQNNSCTVDPCAGGGLFGTDTVTISGTQFVNNSAITEGGGVAADTPSLTGALFMDNSCTADGCKGGGLMAGQAVAITRSQFINNSADVGGAVHQLGAGGGRIVNSIFARNVARGADGAALYLGSTGAVDLIHTTIASPTVGAGSAIFAPAGVVNITNTLIASYTTGIEQSGSATVSAWNTLFHATTSQTAGTVANNTPKTGDPLFADQESDNYRLAVGSAAINTGVDAGVLTDFDGTSRPQLVLFDIGSFEYNPCSVTSTNDNGPGTLRRLLANPACSTIVFDVGVFGSPQTIQLTSTLPITRAVTVDGAANSVYTPTIQGPGAGLTYFRVLSNTAAATLNQVIVAGGSLTNALPIDAMGAGIYNTGALTLTNSVVARNRTYDNSPGFGAGIYSGDGGVLTLVNSTLVSNTAYYGGGLYLDSGTAVLDHASVAINTATSFPPNGGSGGGIYLNGGSLVVTNTSVISGNIAYGNLSTSYGGGLYAASGTTIQVTGSNIAGNFAHSSGGGVYSRGQLTVTNSSIISNTAAQNDGGGFYLPAGGSFFMSGSTVADNRASAGGGIGSAETGPITITTSVFARNDDNAISGYNTLFRLISLDVYSNTNGVATGQPLTVIGGNYYSNTAAAILANGGVVMTDVVMYGNTNTSHGGAVYTQVRASISGGRFEGNSCIVSNCNGGAIYVENSTSPLTITGTQFISNTSVAYGGGAYGSGPVVVTNTLFQGNRADGNQGGGLYGGFTSTPMVVTGSRFINNFAGSFGGGLSANNDLTLADSVVSGNRVAQSGGGIYGARAMAITRVDIISNTATTGGGVTALDSLVMTNVNVLSNTAASNVGGGVYATNAVRITGSTFRNNTITAVNSAKGSGLYASSTTAPVFVSDTPFIGGRALDGGGAYVSGPATFSNVIFQDNFALFGNGGGGLFANSATAPLVLTNTLFLSNSSTAPGGGLYAAGPTWITGGSFEHNQCPAVGCTTTDGLISKTQLTMTLSAPYTYTDNIDLRGNMWVNGNVTFTAGIATFNIDGGGVTTHTLTGSAITTFKDLEVVDKSVLDVGSSVITVTGVSTNSGVIHRLAPIQTIAPSADFTYNDGVGRPTAVIRQTGGTDMGDTTVRVSAHLTSTAFACGAGSFRGRPALRYYNITPTNGAGVTGDLSLTYYDGVANSEANTNVPSNLMIYRCDGTNWQPIYGSYTTGADGNYQWVKLSNYAFPSFSYFAIAAAPSNNANLTNLTLSQGTLTPAFAFNTTIYTASVANSVTSLTVTPVVTDTGARIRVNSVPVTSGVASGPINLVVGPNVITTVVTAEDTFTTRTYTVTVTRLPSSNAQLSNLSISQGTLTPVFATGTTVYTASVANSILSLTVTPVVSDPTATIKVNDAPVTSGSPSGPISLGVGPNVITTVVTAEDTTTTRTYTVTVTRAPSTDAWLTNLSISQGTLTPAFASVTATYTAGVPNSVAAITVTPVVSDATATVKVNNVSVVSGSPSGPISLIVGANVITTVVTAEDTTTTRTYTVTITRAPSSNADVTDLVLNHGVLTPVFSPVTFGYTSSVTNGIKSLTVTPILSDTTATAQVNGVVVTSSTPSGPIPIYVGDNRVTTTVTAQDGVTIRTYVITVTRDSTVGPWYVDPTGNDINTCTAPGADEACRTIGGAIHLARAGDTIYIASGTYPENLAVNVSLNFIGDGAATTIVDGGGTDRVFQITAGAVSFSALTVQHGSIAANGAGIHAPAGSPVTLVDVTLRDNRALSTTTGTGSGGGAALLGGATVEGGLVTGNVAERDGGGLFVATTLTLSGTQLISNTAALGAGGLGVDHANAGVTNATFERNQALGGQGGGVSVDMGELTLTNTTFVSNTAGSQGGGVAVNGNVTITGGTLQTNSTAGMGGGIVVGGNLIVSRTLFTENYATLGAAAAGVTGSLQVEDARFTGNVTPGAGGGVLLGGAGASHVINTIFDGNLATAGGSALYLFHPAYYAGGSIAIVQTTIASPTAAVGSAIMALTGTVGISDTIIANYSNGVSRSGGGSAFQDYNLFASVTTPIVGSIGGGAHSLTATNPYFADAAAHNYQLTPASSAFDTGVNAGVDVDIVGVQRPQGATWDMGAYELTGVTVLAVTSQVAPSAAAPRDPVTYTIHFTNTGATVATGVVITDLVPSSLRNLAVASSGVAITLTQVAPPYAWQVENLIPGAVGMITITGVITDYLVPGTVFTNTVTFAADNAHAQSNSAPLTVNCPTAYTVNTTADAGVGSLRQGLLDVCPGSVIDFAPALTVSGPATITLTSARLTIAQSLTISGPGASLLIVSGNNGLGVLQTNTGVTANVLALTIRNGQATQGAGVINRGRLSLTDMVIISNTATSSGGGAIYNSATGALTLATSTVASNTAAASGGGISTSGALTITNSTIRANSSPAGGGGVSQGSGTLVVIASSIYSNTTFGAGGGISGAAGVIVANSTIAGNSAWGNGGAIYVGSGSITLTQSSLSGESTYGQGGGLFISAGATLDYTNTVIANNAAGGDCVNNGVLAGNTRNLVEDGSCGAALSGEAFLGALGNYGGATWTLPLLPGSPAIDAADGGACLPTDQRGISRTPATCDIGAFESQGFTLSGATGADQHAIVGEDFAQPLALTIGSAHAEPVVGGSVIFTAPLSGATMTPATLTGTVAVNGGVHVSPTAGTLPGVYNVRAAALGITGAEIYTLTNDFGPANHLVVAGYPATPVAGESGIFTVTVQDRFSNVVTSYAGTIGFTSGDGLAELPGAYIFTGPESGQKAFTATLKTAGSQIITATDTLSPTVTGAQRGIQVQPSAPVTISVATGNDQHAIIGDQFAAPLQALVVDVYNNQVLAGVPVTFTAPTALGPSALFTDGAGVGAATYVTTTRTGGVATARPLAANLYGGVYSVTAEVAGVVTTAGFALTNDRGTGNVAINSAPGAPVYGEPITVTAIITSTPPGVTPTGSVTFTVDGIDAVRPVDGTGAATLLRSDLLAGDHGVIATYSGDDNLNLGVSTLFTQTINRSSTAITVTSDPNPSAAQSSITFTATVESLAPGAGTPTGSVTFTVGVEVFTATLDGSGVGVAEWTTLYVGTHPVNAAYSGDANFVDSTITGKDQLVECLPTVTVRITGDDGLGSLRRALADVCAGGAIYFDPVTFTAPQTITLLSTLAVPNSMTLDGYTGGIAMPTISGNDANRVFAVGANIPVTFTHIAVVNGRAPQNGAGIHAPDTSPVWLVDVTLRDNRAVSVTTETGSGGGAALLGGATIEGGLVTGNVAENQAGGIYVAGALTLSGTQFISNTAAANAGGLGYERGYAAITNATFERNQALTGQGGGLGASLAELAVVNSTFVSNTAATAGGGLAASPVVTLTGGTLQLNRSGSVGGGGIILGDLTVSRTLFSENFAQSGGAAVGVTGQLLVDAARFERNNTPGVGGGALLGGDGASQISNSLFDGNDAAGGSALYLFHPQYYAGGTMEIVQTTIASPTGAIGTAIMALTGTVGISDTLIANYTAGFVHAGGGSAFQDYNLFANVTSPVAGVVGGGEHSLTATDPYFADAAAHNYQLTPASAAFDTGVDVGVDVDIVDTVRPQGATWDMGAYELTGVTAFEVTAQAIPTAAAPRETITYTIHFTNSGLDVATGVVITDLVPNRFSNLAVASAGVEITLTQVAPPYVWQVENMVAGAEGVITITGVMTDYQVPGDVFTNTVTFGAENARPRTSDTALTVNCPPVYTVNTTADAGIGSLRQGLSDTCPGGKIDFDTVVYGASQTIQLTSGGLTVEKDVTIDGAANGVLTPTLSGPGDLCVECFRVITVTAGVNVTLDRLDITNGYDIGAGGGGIHNSGQLTITGSTLFSNTAPVSSGGAIFNDNGATLNLAAVTFIGNRTPAGSGGALANSGAVAIGHGDFSSNEANGNGGAIANAGGAVTIELSTFTGNRSANGSGGAIADASNGVVTIAGSTFTGNTALGVLTDGGALYGHDEGNNAFFISGSTFNGNQAYEGGAIGSFDILHLSNSTFYDNVATGGDGGGALRVAETLFVTNTTFYSNVAPYNGGGFRIAIDSGTYSFVNTIVAANPGGDCNSAGGAITGAANLATDASCGFNFTQVADVLLGSFGDYGGPTGTAPLLPGSPAIDTGNVPACLPTDQRGIARSATTCDIGAFESQGFTLQLAGGDNQQALVDKTFALPLTVTVSSAYTEPIDGGLLTYASPVAPAAGITAAPIVTTPIAGGSASILPVANAVAGSYTVSTTAAGGVAPVLFALENLGNGTTTTLTSTVNPGFVNDQLSFHVTVDEVVGGASVLGALFPSGWVTVTDPTGAISLTGELVNGGVDLTAPWLAAGTYTVTATYPGDWHFAPSVSNRVIQVVEKHPTATDLVVAPNPVTVGDPFVLTATVTWTGINAAGELTAQAPAGPRGTVEFMANDVLINRATLTAAGLARIQVIAPQAGAYTVTAKYLGNDANLPSDSQKVVGEVLQRATTVDLTSAPNPSKSGQTVILSATVNAVYAGSLSEPALDPRTESSDESFWLAARPPLVPTGEVIFAENGVEFGRGTLVKGVATYADSLLPAGVHTITAEYVGDINFVGNTSGPYQQVVQPLPTARNDAAGALGGDPVQIAVLDNDLDPAHGELVVAKVSKPGHGAVVINPGAQSVTYTPTNHFSGVDTFTYTAKDINNATSTASVMVIVAPKSLTNAPQQVAPTDPSIAGTAQFTSTSAGMRADWPAGFYDGELQEQDILFLSYTPVVTPTEHTQILPGNLKFGNFEFMLDLVLNQDVLAGYRFAEPITLTIWYDPALLANLREETLVLERWNVNSWSTAGVTLVSRDLANHVLEVTIDRTGEFAFFAEPQMQPTTSGLYLPEIYSRYEVSAGQLYLPAVHK